MESGSESLEDAAEVYERSGGGVRGDLLSCCLEARFEFRDVVPVSTAKLTEDFLLGPSFSPSSSTSSWYLSSSTIPMAFSSSPSISFSSSSSPLALALVIKYTPKNVNTQPPKNFPNRDAFADWKSRYKTALPIITEMVNRTNCIGMTWVESKCCNARLT